MLATPQVLGKAEQELCRKGSAAIVYAAGRAGTKLVQWRRLCRLEPKAVEGKNVQGKNTQLHTGSTKGKLSENQETHFYKNATPMNSVQLFIKNYYL